MCGHCGCGGVPAIGELREEHLALQEQAHGVRRALGEGDGPTAVSRLTRLATHLGRHVEREERGVFTALREQGEFAEEVEALEGEKRAEQTGDNFIKQRLIEIAQKWRAMAAYEDKFAR